MTIDRRGNHGFLVGTNVHVPHAFEYADALARGAAIPAQFDDEDVGKLAFQIDDDSLWRLKSINPSVIWTSIAEGIGGPMGTTAVGSFHVSGNLVETILLEDIWTDLDLGIAVASSDMAGFSLTDTATGELTFNGPGSFDGMFLASISFQASGASPEYLFRMVVNGSPTADVIEMSVEAPSANVANLTLISPLVLAATDTVRVQVLNVDNNNNITIVSMSARAM